MSMVVFMLVIGQDDGSTYMFGLDNNWGMKFARPGTSNNYYLRFSFPGSGGNNRGIQFWDATSQTTKMFINSDGNVGIGTTNPVSILDVNLNSTTTSALHLRNGNGSTIFNNGAQISFGFTGSNQYKHFIHTRHNASDTDNAIDFYVCDGTQNNTLTSGSTRIMSIENEGLYVYKSSGGTLGNPGGTIFFRYNSSYSAGAISALDEAGSGSYNGGLTFWTWNRNASAQSPSLETGAGSLVERMRIDKNGNVGIGTTDPGSYRLKVQGDMDVTGTLTYSNVTYTNNTYNATAQYNGPGGYQDGGYYDHVKVYCDTGKFSSAHAISWYNKAISQNMGGIAMEVGGGHNYPIMSFYTKENGGSNAEKNGFNS